MVYRKLRRFKFIEMGAYRDTLEIVALLPEFLEAFAVKVADFYQLADFCNGFLQITNFSWRYFERIGEKIVCENNTVFIHNQTAVGDNRHKGDAVILSERLVMVVLRDLQVRKSERQDGKQGEYDQPSKAKSELEIMLLVKVIFKFGTHA